MQEKAASLGAAGSGDASTPFFDELVPQNCDHLSPYRTYRQEFRPVLLLCLVGGGLKSVIEPGDRARGKTRLIVFAAILGVCGVALIVKLVQLMIVIPSREGEQGLVLPNVERGAILDRRGRILAITTKQKTVSAWVPGITSVDDTAGLLAGALGMDENGIKNNWNSHPGYALVKRKISSQEEKAIQDLKSAGKLAGISLEDEYGRSYPQGRLASHVIGWVGTDNVPWDGVEYTLNDDLSPQPVGTDHEAVFGNQVFLTIDADAQYMVEKVARDALNRTKADSLMILVMDARSGEIIAYSSLPDFDPNEFQKDSPQVSKSSLANRPVSLAYEPGSVFKIFSISSLLDLGAITPQSHFFCPGYYEKKLKDGTVIRINCIAAHGDVTPQLILKYSCNAGAAYASDAADSDSFDQMLVRFGFGKETGIPLLGESPGLLRPVSQWSARSKPTITIGQEVSVSAIQVLSAATALANGGVLLKPLIVKKIVSPDGKTIKEFDREPRWEVITPDTARTVLDMMKTATEEGGTARRAAIPGLPISAKTGTAQTLNTATGKYSESDFVASTIGIFPTDDPRMIAYVVIQNPKGESYLGSTIAAPVLREVILRLADLYGIPRQGSQRVAHSGEFEVKMPNGIEVSSVMPDLTGTPKKLLLPLLLRNDVSVTIKGSGFVVKQDPPPGAKIEKGTKIILELQ
jgi:cell division protein FtsI (penicillin-binding protein 3)